MRWNTGLGMNLCALPVLKKQIYLRQDPDTGLFGAFEVPYTMQEDEIRRPRSFVQTACTQPVELADYFACVLPEPEDDFDMFGASLEQTGYRCVQSTLEQYFKPYFFGQKMPQLTWNQVAQMQYPLRETDDELLFVLATFGGKANCRDLPDDVAPLRKIDPEDISAPTTWTIHQLLSSVYVEQLLAPPAENYAGTDIPGSFYSPKH